MSRAALYILVSTREKRTDTEGGVDSAAGPTVSVLRWRGPKGTRMVVRHELTVEVRGIAVRP